MTEPTVAPPAVESNDDFQKRRAQEVASEQAAREAAIQAEVSEQGRKISREIEWTAQVTARANVVPGEDGRVTIDTGTLLLPLDLLAQNGIRLVENDNEVNSFEGFRSPSEPGAILEFSMSDFRQLVAEQAKALTGAEDVTVYHSEAPAGDAAAEPTLLNPDGTPKTEQQIQDEAAAKVAAEEAAKAATAAGNGPAAKK